MKSNVGCFLNCEHEVFKSEKMYADDARKTNHRLHKDMIIIADHLFTIEKRAQERTVLTAMLDKLCSYAHNQLPGGYYWEPDPHILSKLDPSNDICQSALGLNEYLTTTVRNLHPSCSEQHGAGQKNKTMKWLNTLPEDCQSSVATLAMEVLLANSKLENKKAVLNDSKL